MGKHTPGPWRAAPRIAGNGWGVWCTENWYGVLDNTAPGIDAEANARLIAAAPELLLALQNTVNVLALAVENGCFGDALSDDEDTIAEVESVVDAARAAIRKATGEPC